ncbi:MAG: CaiB/BaiF CoA transferase family protein [Gammaproteobacteria bacterium]
MAGPLTGIRVLDLSRVMAGPWCTQILADLGAEVIKIERIGSGDETRQWGPPWLRDSEGNDTKEASYYLCANRGKHSLTVNISLPEGQRIVSELARQADVFIENFKVGSLAGKGLGYADMRRINAGIIYCSITGFGQSGPRATEAGYDYLIQALGGMMSVTGIEDGQPGAGPLRAGIPIADLATGLYAAVAILAALHHREKSGAGQYIDMALLDSQISLLGNQALNYFLSGKSPVRTGCRHPNLAPYQPFKTKDGVVIIAIGNDDQFQRFCRAANCTELAADRRFSSNADRVLNREALTAEMETITRERTSSDWITSLQGVSVPCGPINSLEEVFNDPQVRHRRMRVELNHPSSSSVSGVANPIKFSDTPIDYAKAPPLLGEDTDAVLQRLLGKNREEIEILRRRGVI